MLIDSFALLWVKVRQTSYKQYQVSSSMMIKRLVKYKNSQLVVCMSKSTKFIILYSGIVLEYGSRFIIFRYWNVTFDFFFYK